MVRHQHNQTSACCTGAVLRASLVKRRFYLIRRCDVRLRIGPWRLTLSVGRRSSRVGPCGGCLQTHWQQFNGVLRRMLTMQWNDGEPSGYHVFCLREKTCHVARGFHVAAPAVWTAGVMVPDSARLCRILDRDRSGPGFSGFTNIVSVNNPSRIQYDFYSQIVNTNACAVCVLRKLGPAVT